MGNALLREFNTVLKSFFQSELNRRGQSHLELKKRNTSARHSTLKIRNCRNVAEFN